MLGLQRFYQPVPGEEARARSTWASRLDADSAPLDGEFDIVAGSQPDGITHVLGDHDLALGAHPMSHTGSMTWLGELQRTRAGRDETTCAGDRAKIRTMATNLNIDPRLLQRALEVSGERTKTAAVTRALLEYVARREQKRLVELFSSLEWDPAYDFKRERARQ